MDPVHHQNQDTNDKFLANIQRNGTFSVVPRIAAGEVTPDGLIAIGRVAKKYGLYTKVITFFAHCLIRCQINLRRLLAANALICSVRRRTTYQTSGKNLTMPGLRVVTHTVKVFVL